MSRALLCVLSLGTAAALQTCPLNFVGNVKQFVVEQENGKNRRTVPAVERAMTAKEFYDFNSWSSHTGFEKAGVSNMFLYRDLNHPDHLSFFWTSGIDHPHGNQPTASVDGLISGIPDGVTIAEMDDRSDEFDWTTSSTMGVIDHNQITSGTRNIGCRWRFAENTDGGAIEGLPTNLNWEMKMTTKFHFGIDTWSFHFGDGSTAQDMDPSEPVYLRPVVTTVDTGVAPYPGTAGKETFCTLVKSDNDGEQLTYTFSWGDDTPDTVVTKTEGNLACAEHDFCGPVSATCGGTAPRKVRVFAKGSGCSAVHKILADEEIGTCPPLNFVGDVKQFVVEQENGKNRRTVPAVERAMTAKQFYDFNSVSAHTGLEKAKTSNMFLYRDLMNPDHLSFFWIHGIDHPEGNQPESDVDALITGIPSGVTIAQSDDRTAEWDWTSSNKLGDITHNGENIGGHWWFNQNTDGGALDGFPTNLNWEIKIQANFIRGIDTWSFLFGDGSLQQDMDMSEPVYLRPVVTSVDLGVAPYPQVAGAETFCTLVESITQEQLTYTFKWGDETPDTVVTGPAGHVTCASHDFCGPVSATCGGTAPRKVRVFVSKSGCSTVHKILADEEIGTCPPLNFVGDVKQFVVEQENGKNRRTVPAVERAMTAKQFYDFDSWSAHTGFEKAGTSNMFLYRDLNHPHHLSFFWIHGIDHPQGNQPESDVDALITGIPSGVTIAQSDDRTAEWDWTSSNKLGDITHNGGNIGGHWWFNQNTDGGALDGFPTNLNWEIKIQANFIRGIDTWSFHFGDGSLQQDMDMSEPVYLRPVVTSVDLGVAPYPTVAGPETFCTLVESITQEQLTYTFKWGDNTPDTVVTGPAGSLACATHNFCGAISQTCGGTAPRKVRVFVKKTGCVEMDRILADEKVDDVTCGNHEGVKVSIEGATVAGNDVNGEMEFSNSEAVLTKIPENMREMQVHTPAAIPKDTTITLSCCGTEVCEFIVSHYHCPPCSGKVNGGFPALLPLSGFESASCAPKWGLAEQKMVSYRVQVDAGASLVLPETTEEATSFVIFSKVGELADPWCQKPKKFGCGGPCPPSKCTC